MGGDINLAAICIADGFGAILSIIMLGARIWGRSKNNNEIRLFRMMLYTSLLSCISDTAVFVFDGRPGPLVHVVLFLGNTWLFISNVILGSLWIMTVIAHISGKGLPFRQKLMLYILDTIGCVALLINIFYPLVFKIDSDNIYSRGPLFWLYVVIELIVVADSIVVYFTYRKKCPEAKHFPIWQFMIPVFAGIVVQTCVYGISLIVPSLSIAICGVILGLFSESEEEAEILRQNEMKSRIIIEQQKELEDALSMAQSSNRSKTTFLNNMSHDIRTPMNAIIGYTGLAKRHLGNDEKINDYLNKIENSSDYLLSLINEVLDMSRIESGKMTIFEQTEDLTSIINSVADIVSVDVRNKNHQFNISISDLTNTVIQCDKLRIKQILVNILSNSIKYTPRQGIISLHVTQKPSNLANHATYEFCISDNGIGMNEEYLSILFDPFTRVKSSTVSGIQGTGLGMAITKNLVDMMGGKIDVKSKPNEGTTITVSFEFKTETVNCSYSPNYEKDSFDKTFDLKGKKVLLVEDNELNSEIATIILEENGLIVDNASDGDIAVEKVKSASKGDYDFVLMDIQMPRMDGYEATRRIRESETDNEHITIIAMTANAFEEDRKIAIEAGMDDFLAKPIKYDDLFRVLSLYSPVDRS